MSYDSVSSLIAEVERLDAEVAPVLERRDGAAVLLKWLPEKFTPVEISQPGDHQRVWELVGCFYMNTGRQHEALAVFWALYQHMLSAQNSGTRVHKGMPLVWMSDCYARLGFRVHAKRFLMLTLCEDALAGSGSISAESSGVYFRLVWQHGLRDAELRRYASDFWQLCQEHSDVAGFPEALLQRVDRAWLSELPSEDEALLYLINERYVRFLLDRLGDEAGEQLELLAEYLLSCMPGCRTTRRHRSPSTDYDVVCSIDGVDVDFRSELGRYFVCECKDWSKPADFTTIAKFCRVLDSTKARFGILFSSSGVSGDQQTRFAAREQLKVFQDRGVVIVVLDKADLETIAKGADLISLLRTRYEAVRLDIRPLGSG